MTVPLQVGNLDVAAQPLAQAAQGLEGVNIPGVPDAGASSAAFASVFSSLASALGSASKGSAQAADLVQTNAKAYHDTDHKTGQALHNAGKQVPDGGKGGGH